MIVDPPEAIAEAYATGRGSFRVRARWHKEETGRGTYQIIITEVPWLVQKGRLVEKLAELLNEKKLPLVADVRDESAEDIRLVIEPRARTVDAELLMESLFKLSELESRIPLNMNVLVKGRIPKVVGLAEALTRMARASPRRAGAALEIPPRQDRASARSAGRLPDRLSEPRQGDQDHPHRGRAQAGPDQDLQAHRRSGRRHPQHAAAQPAQARGDGDPQGGQGPARRAQEAQRAARLREGAVEDGRGAKSRRSARTSVRRPRSASAAPRSPRRPSTTRRRSRRRWSSASRSPSWSRRRAGFARCAAPSPISPASPSRPTTA